jgi:hypothetical protein
MKTSEEDENEEGKGKMNIYKKGLSEGTEKLTQH